METFIRQEQERDRLEVSRLIQAAFLGVEESDHREHLLVERLRRAPGFVPALSLVAEAGGLVTGYALMTPVEIAAPGTRFPSLALAPVAVLPAWQGRGTGSALIREAHRRAAALGYRSAVVLGHAAYYPRFGYRQADAWGIAFPFDAPPACCMAAELVPGGLKGVHGTVVYPEAFG